MTPAIDLDAEYARITQERYQRGVVKWRTRFGEQPEPPKGDSPAILPVKPIHCPPRSAASVRLASAQFRGDVLRLRKEGKSRAEMAAALMCCASVIGKALQHLVAEGLIEKMVARPRIGRPKGTYHKADITGSEIVKRCAAGESLVEIARSLGCHKSLICARRKEYLAAQAKAGEQVA